MEIVTYLGNPVYFAGFKNRKPKFHNPKALLSDGLIPHLFATLTEYRQMIRRLGIDKCGAVAYHRFVPIE